MDPEDAPVQRLHSTETLAQNPCVVADFDSLECPTEGVEYTLVGSLAAARPDHLKIPYFMEDDYDGLKILMHIIHSQFPQVPTSLIIISLHRMASLTHK